MAMISLLGKILKFVQPNPCKRAYHSKPWSIVTFSGDGGKATLTTKVSHRSFAKSILLKLTCHIGWYLSKKDHSSTKMLVGLNVEANLRN